MTAGCNGAGIDGLCVCSCVVVVGQGNLAGFVEVCERVVYLINDPGMRCELLC